MTESDHTDAERPRGILNTRDREYLLGESDIEPRSQRERERRSDIRERAWNGLLDLQLLANELEDRDLQQLLPNREATDSSDESARETAAYFQAMVGLFSFGYRAVMLESSYEHFKSITEAAIQRHEERQALDTDNTILTTRPDVAVSITPPRTINTAETLERYELIARGDDLGYDALSVEEAIFLAWAFVQLDEDDELFDPHRFLSRWLASNWDMVVGDFSWPR